MYKLILVLSLFFYSTGLFAQIQERQKLPSQHRVLYTNTTGVRYNSLGAATILDVTYKYRLYNNNDILWRDAYLGISQTTYATPAAIRTGFRLEIQPIAVLKFSLSYLYIKTYGAFHLTRSFQSATSGASRSELKAADMYSTFGHQVKADVLLQAKAGRFAIMSTTSFIYNDLQLQDGHVVFYSGLLDIMAPNHSWVLNNDTNLVYVTDSNMFFGLNFNLTHSFFNSGHFQNADHDEAPNSTIVRLGPLFAMQLADNYGKYITKPTFVVILNWWLLHAYRTGQDVDQAVPFVLSGIRFHGELFSFR
jgi:hypothetical protein